MTDKQFVKLCCPLSKLFIATKKYREEFPEDIDIYIVNYIPCSQKWCSSSKLAWKQAKKNT